MSPLKKNPAKPVTRKKSVKKPPQNASSCPACGGTDISWGGLEADGDSASQSAFCIDCECHWHTVFKFTHNEIHN